MSMTYNYSSTQNNGQITSSVDNTSGETITYQYDALKRLLSAAGKSWGETYTYDGFGNLTQMQPTGTAGAPSLSVTVDATTNRLTASGAQYDKNGNLLTGFPGIELQYDTANRVSEVMESAGNSYYLYDSDNRRIYYRNASNSETIYFYGADGTKLATYTYTIIPNNGNPVIQFTQQSANVYFLGKLIFAEGFLVTTDRLGSVRNGGPSGLGYQAQYPYGVEYTVTVNDREKYATYARDSLTGFDYAMNRYYSSQWGRFLSPDPYGGSVGLRSPQTWNRYAYSANDPTNGNDPTGLDLDDFGDGFGYGFEDPFGSMPGLFACFEAGIYDASIDCGEWDFGFFIPGFGFLPAPSPLPEETTTMRRIRQAAINAALVAIAKATAGQPTIPLWPAAIEEVNMCSTQTGFGAYELEVTYRIISELGTTLKAPNLTGVSITESFPMQTGNLQLTPGTWSQANNTINTNGQFIDTLSSNSTPIVARSGTAFQEFTAYGWFGVQPLDIIFGGVSLSGVNYNTYSKTAVTANGQTAKGPCGG
jgi:RHS repeat-associated protein